MNSITIKIKCDELLKREMVNVSPVRILTQNTFWESLDRATLCLYVFDIFPLFHVVFGMHFWVYLTSIVWNILLHHVYEKKYLIFLYSLWCNIAVVIMCVKWQNISGALCERTECTFFVQNLYLVLNCEKHPATDKW